MDFDGENGYMLLGDDFILLEFETVGDLDYLRECETIYYSLYDGFMQSIDGEFVSYNNNKEQSEKYWQENEVGKIYNGQDAEGSGKINNTNAYVADRYGATFSLDATPRGLVDGFSFVLQNELSCYQKEFKVGYLRGEGNCSLAAMYGALNYYAEKKSYSNFPKSIDQIFYNNLYDDFNESVSDKGWISKDFRDSRFLPKLYFKVRENAIAMCNYTVDGFNPFNEEKVLEKTARDFGYNIDAKHNVVLDFGERVAKHINAGYPSLFNIANGTYADHTVVVIGYKIYSRTVKVLFWKKEEYVKLIEVNDNDVKESRFFDFTNYNGFGSFVSMR